MRRRKLVCVCSLMLASLAVSLGAAWACTEFTGLVAPRTGAAMSGVLVKGMGQVKPQDAAKQVEVRWNDVTGPVLVTSNAAGMAAGVQATIPNVPAGIYFLLAVIDGKGIARTSIEVASAAGEVASPADFRPLQPAPQASLSRTSDGSSSQVAGMALLAGGLIVLFGGALAGLSLQSRKARVAATPLGDHNLTA